MKKYTLQIDSDEEMIFTIEKDYVLFECFDYPRKKNNHPLASFGMSKSNFERAVIAYNHTTKEENE